MGKRNHRFGLGGIAVALVAVLALVLLQACGGGGTGPPGPRVPIVSLVIFGQDEPKSNLLSLHVTYSFNGLVPQSGAVVAFIDPLTFKTDLAALVDFSTILDAPITAVPAGTYTGITVALSNPQLVVLDTTQNPPVPKAIPALLTSSTVIVPLNPPLVLTDGGNRAVMIDFNLDQSVETDASGQITGTINPVATARLLNASGPDGFGTFDDFHGVVFSVDTSSINGFFTGLDPGDFDPLLLVSAHSYTQFVGVSGLGALQKGEFVDVGGFVDSNTNINARVVQAEAVENLALDRAAFLGLVTSVTRDAQGSATQFTMLVREQTPELTSVVATGSVVVVNLATSTAFDMLSPVTNFSQLTFAPAGLAAGEHVSVHGTATAGSPPTVDATKVFLRRQSLTGSFSGLLGAGADQKTGGFIFTPDSGLYQGQKITVYTAALTNFLGVANLTSISSGQKLIIKGHLFFETAAGSVNGIPWTPPALVLIAEQVHAT
jgi:hypothetical protein